MQLFSISEMCIVRTHGKFEVKYMYPLGVGSVGYVFSTKFSRCTVRKVHSLVVHIGSAMTVPGLPFYLV